MATTRIDYPELAVKAAEMVLLELTRILGEYRDNIVVIGGMVSKCKCWILKPVTDQI